MRLAPQLEGMMPRFFISIQLTKRIEVTDGGQHTELVLELHLQCALHVAAAHRGEGRDCTISTSTKQNVIHISFNLEILHLYKPYPSRPKQ